MISRKILTLLVYILLLSLLFVFQPSLMFDSNGNIKEFSIKNNDNTTTIISLTIVLPILAILCYFIVLIFQMILT